MGSSNSKESKLKNDKKGMFGNIKSNVEHELATRMMIQREIQMAVNIARARDNIYIFGSAWLTLVGGVGFAKVMGKPVSSVAGVPIVIGALLLGNLADMAYGNKLVRVAKEAEYIMENERARFVPPKQASFSGLYSDDEKAMYFDLATPVGELFPNNLYARSFVPKKKD